MSNNICQKVIPKMPQGVSEDARSAKAKNFVGTKNKILFFTRTKI